MLARSCFFDQFSTAGAAAAGGVWTQSESLVSAPCPLPSPLGAKHRVVDQQYVDALRDGYRYAALQGGQVVAFTTARSEADALGEAAEIRLLLLSPEAQQHFLAERSWAEKVLAAWGGNPPPSVRDTLPPDRYWHTTYSWREVIDSGGLLGGVGYYPDLSFSDRPQWLFGDVSFGFRYVESLTEDLLDRVPVRVDYRDPDQRGHVSRGTFYEDEDDEDEYVALYEAEREYRLSCASRYRTEGPCVSLALCDKVVVQDRKLVPVVRRALKAAGWRVPVSEAQSRRS